MKRLLVLVAVIVMVAGSSLFLARPADAGRNCLSTLSGNGAGDRCIAQCLANTAETCTAAPDVQDCIQMIRNPVLVLANLRPGMMCNEAIAATLTFCGCP